jgi:serine/threonine-protein phosphatase 6 regulatory subunit 3
MNVLGNDPYMHHQEDDDDDDEYEEDEQHNNEAFTSIWDLVPGYTQSPLDGMIDKAGTTLEDVLDEDTLIQELKSNNQKVISFLCKEENVDRMIDYLINEQYKETYKDFDENLNQEEVKSLFKYPYMVSEIINCDVEDIVNVIVSSKERLFKLFSYFKNRRSDLTCINPSHSQHYIKSLSALLQKHYKRIVASIIELQKEDPTILESIFVKHVDLCDMDTLVLKLMGFETNDESFDQDAFGAFATQQRIRELFLAKQRGNDQELQQRRREIRQLLTSEEGHFVPSLLNKLEEEVNNEEVHRNIFNILSEVVEKSSQKNEIAQSILNTEQMSRILDILLRNSQNSIFIHGIPFLRIVIEHRAKSEESDDEQQQQQQQEQLDTSLQNHDANDEATESIIALIASRTKDFLSLLTLNDGSKGKLESVTTTTGTLNPPMGEMRLKVVEHLQTLFKISVEQPEVHSVVHQELVSHNIFQVLLKLFFQYEFNNILHCQVFSIIQMVLESKDPELTRQLIVDAHLIEGLLEAYKKNETLMQNRADSKAFQLGHMGFIVDIANLVRRQSLEPSSIAAGYLQQHETVAEGWREFVTNFLEPRNSTNEKQLGGPPPLGNAFQNYQFDDDEEEDDYHYDDDSDSDEDNDDEVVLKKSTNSDDDDSEDSDDDSDVIRKPSSNNTTSDAPNAADFEADFSDAQFE